MTLMEKLFEKHMLMNKVKELQKENAELRECLKEAVEFACKEIACEYANGECGNHGCRFYKLRTALEGGR